MVLEEHCFSYWYEGLPCKEKLPVNLEFKIIKKRLRTSCRDVEIFDKAHCLLTQGLTFLVSARATNTWLTYLVCKSTQFPNIETCNINYC